MANVGGTAVTTILSEIRCAKQEVLDAVRRGTETLLGYQEIEDPDLRRVVGQLRANMDGVARDAAQQQTITLAVDDLYSIVYTLMEEAKAVDAVDIEINRWEKDRRSVQYFVQSSKALLKGALIRRVYIINPHVDSECLGTVMRAIEDHVNFSQRDDIQRAGGRMQLRGIHHGQVPAHCRGKDFAIFDGDKVICETFDGNWTSSHCGYFSKAVQRIQECQHVFLEIWNRATPLHTSSDVRAWENTVVGQLAVRRESYDVFVGYARTARTAALELKNLIASLGYSVMDWQEQFRTGSTVLEEIGRADSETRVGLFLFSADDALEFKRADLTAVVRDNVVFEAGYFLKSKGPSRVAIVLEQGARMPSDLGGTIYIPLCDRTTIAGVETQLRRWLTTQLGSPS